MTHRTRRRSWLRLFALPRPARRRRVGPPSNHPPRDATLLGWISWQRRGRSCSRSWRSASSSSSTRAATSSSRACRACASTASRSASVPSCSASSAARPSIRSPRSRSAASCRSRGSTRARRASPPTIRAPIPIVRCGSGWRRSSPGPATNYIFAALMLIGMFLAWGVPGLGKAPVVDEVVDKSAGGDGRPRAGGRDRRRRRQEGRRRQPGAADRQRLGRPRDRRRRRARRQAA